MISKEERATAARREAIGKYVRLRHVGTPKEDLFIHINELLRFLMAQPRIQFSASAFEDTLEKELKEKVIGRQITPETFASICDYIWQLALYLTAQRNIDEQNTAEVIKKRALAARERKR